MSLEEIERLREKIEKDPFSKLFVPLAEEYKKAGMYDEAIDVLTGGLEKQPGYLSARVSLGQIYVERGLPDNARAEFEKVIEAIPDNLFAHKKLAEIYKDLGEKDRAAREFKTVLRLNPADEWAATSLAEIEGTEEDVSKPAEEKPAELTRTEESATEDAKEEEPQHISPGEDVTDLSALRSEIAEDIEPQEGPEVPASGQETEIWGQHAETFIEMEEERPPATSISEEDMKLWKAHAETTEETGEAGEETVTEAEQRPEEDAFSFEDVFKKPQTTAGQAEEIAGEAPGQPSLTVGDADLYISQEKYSDAMNVYRSLLSADPGNNRILQRVEELRALLKMLGKDKDQLISRLDSFLDGVRKRRDEFFGSA
jgi:tetratricopeptide (TPR) repeat protein